MTYLLVRSLAQGMPHILRQQNIRKVLGNKKSHFVLKSICINIKHISFLTKVRRRELGDRNLELGSKR